jgi:DNA-binding IclR family transcriptional regulator
VSSSAKRALRILRLIGRADRPLGVTEIARELSLPAATVFRSLDALNRADLIARYRSSSRYVPGHAAERLRRSLIARFRMREVCLPYMRQLASMSGETISLHVRLGWYAVRICSAPGAGEVMNSPPLGEAQALGECPAGRAILAFLPKTEIVNYCGWSARQGTGRVKPSTLREVAAAAYAVGEGEIAFPIRADNRAIAALAIDGLTNAIQDCREIVAKIETLARTQPALFENPLSHIDADSILS